MWDELLTMKIVIWLRQVQTSHYLEVVINMHQGNIIYIFCINIFIKLDFVVNILIATYLHVEVFGRQSFG